MGFGPDDVLLVDPPASRFRPPRNIRWAVLLPGPKNCSLWRSPRNYFWQHSWGVESRAQVDPPRAGLDAPTLVNARELDPR
jgi:hypothetical protein